VRNIPLWHKVVLVTETGPGGLGQSYVTCGIYQLTLKCGESLFTQPSS